MNVFAGSPRSSVEVRLGDAGPWVPMTRVIREDPAFAELKALEKSSKRPRGKDLQKAKPSPHLWAGQVPSPAKPGFQLIQVRTTDLFGQTFRACRVIRYR